MKNILLAAGIFMSMSAQAQIGIGTTTPRPSAALDVTSSNKGFLPPRIALTGMSDVTTISSPDAGLLIYNTATAGSGSSAVKPGYYYWNGSSWVRLAVETVSNSYVLASTGTASIVNQGQTIATGSYIDINNSTITVTVPAGYTSVQVMVRWDIWGDAATPSNSTVSGNGSLRFQIVQTGTSSQTISNVMMSSWAALGGGVGVRWNAPVSYLISGLTAGTYNFKLQLLREGETSSPNVLIVWGFAGTAQVFVK